MNPDQTATADSTLAYEHIEVSAGDYRFHALSQGDGPLVLCLHGFPDYPGSYAGMLAALANAGYRAVAPYQRGYHPDTLSADMRYQTIELAQDALNLIDALGYENAVVIGHDWGSSIASGAAVLAPAKVRALITAAVPYGTKLGEALLIDPEQQRRSWYMFFFQTELAEMAVSYENMAFIRRLWQDWSPGWDFSETAIQGVLDTLAQPGVLNAALTYYRCALNPDYQRPDIAALQARMGETISVPALYLHGGKDGCIGASTTEGMANNFSGPFELELLPHVGHFLHLEDPNYVHERILAFLATYAPGGHGAPGAPG